MTSNILLSFFHKSFIGYWSSINNTVSKKNCFKKSCITIYPLIVLKLRNLVPVVSYRAKCLTFWIKYITKPRSKYSIFAIVQIKRVESLFLMFCGLVSAFTPNRLSTCLKQLKSDKSKKCRLLINEKRIQQT